MKAVRIHEYGEANVLKYEDAPAPEVRRDGVLIRVRAAGVNPVDWKIRKGLMKAVRPLQFPAIVGADVAGTVERAGALVTRFKPGDPVILRRVRGRQDRCGCSRAHKHTFGACGGTANRSAGMPGEMSQVVTVQMPAPSGTMIGALPSAARGVEVLFRSLRAASLPPTSLPSLRMSARS